MTHKIIIVLCLVHILQAILFHLPDYGTQCYYSQLEADSLHQISVELQRANESPCQIELAIDQQTEEDGQTQFSINRVRTALFCSDTKKPYSYKMSSRTLTNLKKLRVCMTAHEVVNNLVVEFKLKHHENPHYTEDANLSLVSSNQLRTLHDLIHNITNKMVELQKMQENLDQTEDELSKINNELREQIQNLGLVQLFVMLLMGGLWIVIISRANK